MMKTCVPAPPTPHHRPVHNYCLTGYLPPGLVSTEVLKQPLHADYGHLFGVALQGRPVRFIPQVSPGKWLTIHPAVVAPYPVPLQSEVLQHELSQGCEGYIPMVPQEAAELWGMAV